MTAAPLHERLEFDVARGEIRDGPRRYVVLRADVLMGLFDRLPAAEREQALQALGASVKEFGGDSVRAYLTEIGAGGLLQRMEEASASLGWGRWRLEARADALLLTVDNSPFAASTQRASGAACHAITGMLSALASALWSEDVTARELRCACEEARSDRHCVFVASTIGTAAGAGGVADKFVLRPLRLGTTFNGIQETIVIE